MKYLEVNSLDVNSVNEAFYQAVETICANIDSNYYPKSGGEIKESTGILTKGDPAILNQGGHRSGAQPQEASAAPQKPKVQGMPVIAEGQEDENDDDNGGNNNRNNQRQRNPSIRLRLVPAANNGP